MGAGGIAQTFARDLEGTHHEIYAVGSRSLEKAKSFGYGRVFYGSYEELVLDPDIDALYIATPHSHHYENALLSLNAGKPALVEKAFTLNSKQASQLISLARQKNVALMEAMWTRFLPHIAEIRKIVANGEIGEIVSLHAHHGQNISRQRAERLWNPSLGGGALLDLGIYPISFAHLFLGVPSAITARAQLTAEKIDSHTSAIFDYPNGVRAHLDCTMLAATSNTATISGTLGRIEIDAPFFAPTSFRLIKGSEVFEFPTSYRYGGWREEAFAFESVVRSGAVESDLMTHDDTLAIMKLMDEIRAKCGITYAVD